MGKFSLKRWATALAAAGMLVGVTANGAIYWQNVTGDNQHIGSQLSMDISVSEGFLTLTFGNDVGIASDVTEIYIDAPPPGEGDSWFDPSEPTISENIGTTFNIANALNPTPPPGLNGASWQYAVSAGVDSDLNPAQGSNGLDAKTDVLALRFNLAQGVTLTDADVMNAIGAGQFRVAMHIRSIAPTGGSDTYLAVPEPTTMIAGALLLLPFAASTLRIIRKKS